MVLGGPACGGHGRVLGGWPGSSADAAAESRSRVRPIAHTSHAVKDEDGSSTLSLKSKHQAFSKAKMQALARSRTVQVPLVAADELRLVCRDAVARIRMRRSWGSSPLLMVADVLGWRDFDVEVLSSHDSLRLWRGFRDFGQERVCAALAPKTA